MRLFVAILMAAAAGLAVAPGCSRRDYRLRADAESYGILQSVAPCAPWNVPGDFNVMPHPASRFYDPTCPEDPLLPDPAPKLYSYCLPELPQRDPERFRPHDSDAEVVDPISLQSSRLSHERLKRVRNERVMLLANPTDAFDSDRLPSPDVATVATFQRVAFFQDALQNETPGRDAPPDFIPPVSDDPVSPTPEGELPAGDLTDVLDPTETTNGADTNAASTSGFDWRDDTDLLFDDRGLMVSKIDPSVWESIPDRCLRRMLEFESVRVEYERSLEKPVPEALRDQSPSLALEDIIEQAQINSRDFQSQKERLYLTALALTLQQYDYQHKFAPNGNGTSAIFDHLRDPGNTRNVLRIPSRIAIEKMLNTGGDFVASFANNIVMTFNGPQGFATDVSSSIMADFTQTLIQTDVRFESLTQAERNVVYAARNYARFRKTLFRDLSGSYYNLILAYRGIAIDSQDYFSNLRGFNQGQAEYAAGRLPRFQVDQFEQNALRSRSNLISSCNQLERLLDQLKFSIGLPPEIPINVDLTELEQLTLRDEATVSAELVRRARRTLVAERNAQAPDQIVLLNGAIDLARRTANLLNIRSRLGETGEQTQTLRRLTASLAVQESRLLVQQNQDVLNEELQAVPPAPPLRIYQRTMDVVESELRLTRRQLQLAELLETADPQAIEEIENLLLELVDRTVAMETELSQSGSSAEQWENPEEKVEELKRRLEIVNRLVPASQMLLEDVKQVRQQSDVVLDYQPQTLLAVRAATLGLADEVLQVTQLFAEEGRDGLAPVEIDVDEAMLTALVQRFDVMNERGQLADVWRQIKLAGDDLRSVLNLSASHTLGTRNGADHPFDFTLDNSATQVAITFDAPLNRRAQRNAFRAALINYNAALRNLIELQDSIKLAIRDDLRQLQLDREQYRIAVASAALAYERVVSTRLQLRQGVQNVAARDFLEAQQAYTASLNSVAGQHIGFIQDRIALFLDLELLKVDETGFWPELYDERYQPLADAAPPPCSGPAYGCLPTQLWYSPEMLRMLSIPWGLPEIGSCEPEN